MSLYLDSAYVAKCYVTESGSKKVRELVRAESELHSSAWCVAEVACIFHRHTRAKSLTREEALKLQTGFRQDVENGVWLLSPVSEELLHRVERAMQQLSPDVFLRAGNAVHLVTAREAGFSEIWTNDRHLLAAAPHFGLRGRAV